MTVGEAGLPPALAEIAQRTDDGVFHANAWGISWGCDVIGALKTVAAENPRSRSRLCLHPSPDAEHQEMLIVMHRDAVEIPQRRTIGFDTKIAIEGAARLDYFNDEGNCVRSVPLNTGRSIYVHTCSDEFHALSVETEWFVFLEVLAGPFNAATTEYAPWSQSGRGHRHA